MSRAPFPSFVHLPPLAGPAGPESAGPGPPPALLNFLAERFPRVAREVWRERIASGKVLDPAGRPVGFDFAYQPGLRLSYFRELPAEPAVPFAATVLLLTEHFAVVDKPPFLPVIPAGRFVNESLIYRLRQSLGNPHVQPVHRLDRETAGVVLLALRPETRSLYHRLFDAGEVEKEYLAIGRGEAPPPWRERTVASLVARGEPWFRMREVPTGTPAAPANARTRVEVLGWRDGRALFRLWPETGRKHQLRLHLAGLGYPIENDRLYPTLQAEGPDDFTRPLQLLARRLVFRDPLSGERVEVESRRQLNW